ncbi:MAG: hypothetical protein N4A33_00240 [Bacteriovoracaceae bacterium]|jgi:hypothetical protein|nr:hypothetical protein [Bacteriovoracaceae bacterium]
MKSLLILLITFKVFAYTIEDNFSVLRGKLHKGGKLEVVIDSKEHTQTSMFANIKYALYKKGFVPVPAKYLQGDYRQELPKMFEKETGFLELEHLQSIKLKDADLVHMGRVNYKNYKNAHYIQIRPHNKKSLMKLIYHPSARNTGWVNLKMTIYKIPVLGSYSLEGIQKN